MNTPFIQIKIPDRRPPAMPTAGGQGGLVRNDEEMGYVASVS
ncbi:MAG: hypothetical protein AAFW89_11375 [Bacteroidota bacterium]